MPTFSKRPQTHLTDESAARALSKHFGDFVKAAKELGVDRKVLRRLTWANPAILAAAHERMEWAIWDEKNKIIRGLWSSKARVRERACDRLENPVLREKFAGAGRTLDFLPIPAPRVRRVRGARGCGPFVIKRVAADLAAEREQARAADWEQDRRRELELEREREREVRPATLTPAPAPTGSLWPAGIRRPTRGRRWRY